MTDYTILYQNKKIPKKNENLLLTLNTLSISKMQRGSNSQEIKQRSIAIIITLIHQYIQNLIILKIELYSFFYEESTLCNKFFFII